MKFPSRRREPGAPTQENTETWTSFSTELCWFYEWNIKRNKVKRKKNSKLFLQTTQLWVKITKQFIEEFRTVFLKRDIRFSSVKLHFGFYRLNHRRAFLLKSDRWLTAIKQIVKTFPQPQFLLTWFQCIFTAIHLNKTIRVFIAAEITGSDQNNNVKELIDCKKWNLGSINKRFVIFTLKKQNVFIKMHFWVE